MRKREGKREKRGYRKREKIYIIRYVSNKEKKGEKKRATERESVCE